MDILTRIANITLIVSLGSVILFVASQSWSSMSLTIRSMSMIRFDILTLITLFLTAALIIMELISYKLHGWYEGIYSNRRRQDFDYQKKDNFPLLYKMVDTDPAVNQDTDKLDTTHLKKVTEGIELMEITLISLIMALLILKNYPIKAGVTAESANSAPVIIRVSVMAYGLALFLVGTYSFWNIFEPLSHVRDVWNGGDLARLASQASGKGYGESSETIEMKKQDGTPGKESVVTYDFFPFTDKDHVLPPPRLFGALLFMMYTCLLTAMGLCFVIWTTNMAENSYEIMKVKSPYITSLSEEGRLMAWEFSDPLIKLVDHCIQKKALTQDMAEAIAPISKKAELTTRLSDENIRLFDIVKIKKNMSVSGRKAKRSRIAEYNDDAQAYLVAAINNWTIIPNRVSGRKFLNIGRENATVGDEPFEDEEGRKLTKNVKPQTKRFAWTDQERADIVRENSSEPIQSFMDPNVARENIYGGFADPFYDLEVDKALKENKPLPKFRGSAIKNAKLYLIPVNLKDLLDYSGDIMTSIQDIINAEFGKYFGEDPKLSPEQKSPPIWNEKYNMPQIFFTGSDGRQEDLGQEYWYGKYEDGSSLDERSKEQKIWTYIRNAYEEQAFSEREGIYGRVYTDIGGAAEMFSGSESYGVKLMSPESALEGKDIVDYRVALRVKENYNIHNLTTADLIYLRYSMIEELALKQNDQDPTHMQNVYRSRLNYLPAPKPLFMEVLPSMKAFVDDEILEEYNEDVGYKENVGKDAEYEINYDINSFAKRFSEVLMEKKEISRTQQTGIEKPQYQSELFQRDPIINDVSVPP